MTFTRISETTIDESLIVKYGTFRNLIVNGAMEIRDGPLGDGELPTCWLFHKKGTCNATGSLGANDGYDPIYALRYYARTTVTTAQPTTPSDNYFMLYQTIEGVKHKNIKAGPAVLSFYVRSSKPGTYCISLRGARKAEPSFVSEYTITQSDTFERKEIFIPSVDDFVADEDDWYKYNVPSLDVFFTLMSGGNFYSPVSNQWVRGNYFSTANQTNLFTTVGNTFDITGIQLEQGKTASPFELLGLEANHLITQRYYRKLDLQLHQGIALNNTTVYSSMNFNAMRTAPSITCVDPMVWVNGINLPANFSINRLSYLRVYFTMQQTITPVVRHQAYPVSGVIHINSLPAVYAIV